MTEAFKNELLNSGYVHRLLKLDKSRSTETRLLKKKTLKSKALWDGKTLEAWRKEEGMSIVDDSLFITAPARTEPEKQMERYYGYGGLQALIPFPNGDDWSGYNRMRCKVKPTCGGLHAPMLTFALVNDGEIKIPDKFYREGAHVVNMTNNEWNECVWEFPDLPRDKITEFTFNLISYGKEVSGGDNLEFYIKDIFLDEVENPDTVLGWQCDKDTICYSMSGYYADGRKIAVTALEGDYEIIEEQGRKAVFSGKISRLEDDKGSFGIIDFSEFKTVGRYKLRAGGITTESFAVSENPFDEALWKVINFVYAERCGYPVNGGHSYCHGDTIGEHLGKKMQYNGGWHDAGDLSQQALQTGEVAHALYEVALSNKKDPLLYNRLMDEANWGLDFILRTRFGDGFRITSVGLLRWTDLIIGNSDDQEAKVHNRSFDNFIFSGVEAFAAFALADYDPDRAFCALKAAKEDFGFAIERFEELGCETGLMMEHTYNAAQAQYYAAASWAASQIFKASGDEKYAREAAKYGNLLLTCQDTGDSGLEFSGFFYRDNTKKTITHFNHQSRDHLFVQALVSLCETQPQSESAKAWENALKLHGEYIKAMARFASPYGMQPAGIHAYSEAEDAETFHFLHVRVDYEQEKENYLKQLEAGIKLNDEYCVRQFPVWFSFRGNSAVMLSTAKAASLIGRLFGDSELIEIARDQLYWHVGKNPFGQSLMYGEGHNYAQQYCYLLGETVGELPVGIQTLNNEDVPYWPMGNNATYKEVWMSTVGRWLWVVADM